MSRDDPGERFPSAELGALVDSLDLEMKEILARHCVGEEAAEQIVYETMMALGVRWDRVRDRRRWFLEALEHACSRDGEVSPPETN